MAPPGSPVPEVMMSRNALRSSAIATARRTSTSSNGGLGFIRMLAATFIGAVSQIASGRLALMSPTSGTVTSNGKIMSNLFDWKARIAVERLGMMVYSTPSR